MVVLVIAFSQIQITSMSSINLLNPKAEYIKKQQAMAVQITAATGMQEVLKTNLGNLFHFMFCLL